jgi:hypothetical protein
MNDHVLDRLIEDTAREMVRPSYETLYHQLGRLREEMPHYSQLNKPETTKWLGRALALVEATPNSVIETAHLRSLIQSSHTSQHIGPSWTTAFAAIIDTAMTRVELRLPAQAQGAFIPAGGVFDAFQAVAKAVGAAQFSALLVDPYADEAVIAEFAPLVPERVNVLVLSDAGTVKPSLKPAAERWIAQY